MDSGVFGRKREGVKGRGGRVGRNDGAGWG